MIKEFKNKINEVKNKYELTKKEQEKYNAYLKELREKSGQIYIGRYGLEEFKTSDIEQMALSDLIAFYKNSTGFELLRGDFKSVLEKLENITYTDILTDFFRLFVNLYSKKLEIKNASNNTLKFGKAYYNATYGGKWQVIYGIQRVITSYEIIMNNCINTNSIEQLKKYIIESKSDNSSLVYKNIKIQWFDNGNIDVTFADSEELKKFLETYKKITNKLIADYDKNRE